MKAKSSVETGVTLRTLIENELYSVAEKLTLFEVRQQTIHNIEKVLEKADYIELKNGTLFKKIFPTGDTVEESEMKFFRTLGTEEEKEFRQWARDNYRKDEDISMLWHPVVKDECNKINEE